MSTVWRWAVARGPSLALAVLFLVMLEAAWLLGDGYAFDVPRVWVLVVSTTVAVFFPALLVEAVYALSSRISPRWAPVLVSLSSLPFIVAATGSLFGGGMVRQTTGFEYARLGFGLLLLTSVAFATYSLPKIVNACAPRPAWRLAFLSATVAFSYADNHLLKALYPAFHYLALGGAIGCACVLGRMLVPVTPERGRAGALTLALVGVAAVSWVLSWNTPSAKHLAAFSGGVVPKSRQVGALFLRPPAGGPSAPSREAASGDIRLKPTVDPEVDEIRREAQNVVFVLIDALRADYVGKLVDGKSLTPQLDALKAESVSFLTAYSPGSFTGGAMPTLMSSFDVPVVQTISEFEVPLVSWMEHLTDRGYDSFANGLCDHLNRSIFEVDVPTCFGAGTTGTKRGVDENLVSEVLEFARRAGGPFAVYTHWLEAHVPFTKIEDYPKQVALLDGRVGQLVDGLRTARLWEETMLIVTSDHGYYLGENGRRANGGCCSDIQMRSPLIVHLPSSRFAGKEVDTLVTTAQVPATIYDVLIPTDGVPVGAESLLHTLYVWNGGIPRFVYAGDDTVGMARLESHKLYWNTAQDLRLLFDLRTDPSERSPIENASVMRAIEERLSAERARHVRQSVFLVDAARSDIPAEALAATLAAETGIGPLVETMHQFWDFKPSVRLLLLQTLFTRNATNAGPALAEVVRRPDDRDDQLLLVMLAFTSVQGACEELASRITEFDARAKVFAAEVVAGLSEDCLATLSQPLTQEIMRVHATKPDLQSDEGRFVTVAVYSLAKRRRAALDGELKLILRDVTLRFAETGTSISTIDTPYLTEGHLMSALGGATTLDDLPLLESIPVTKLSARHLFRKCKASADERCRTILLKVAKAAPRGQLARMWKDLKAQSTPDVAKEFRAVSRERFPDL